MPTDKNKYHGRFSVAGEVHQFWGWYENVDIAFRKFKNKLNAKLKRHVKISDYKVRKVSND